MGSWTAHAGLLSCGWRLPTCARARRRAPSGSTGLLRLHAGPLPRGRRGAAATIRPEVVLVSGGWLHDGPRWLREAGVRGYLHVAGPVHNGLFWVTAVDDASRRNSRYAASARAARQWADSHVKDGRVVAGQLAARRDPRGQDRPGRAARPRRTGTRRSR